MNKAYSKSNKKDKFITDHLLSYIVNRADSSDKSEDVWNNAASMYIFPYRTETGVKLGSLNEPGISWYFDANDKKANDEKTKFSSGSYRIFAEEVFKSDQAKKIRQAIIGYEYATEFTDNVVIKDLINRMSFETDYTELWWTHAYDVFKLWKQDEFSPSMIEATENIDNNYFLFLDDYCNEALREKLIKFGIFRDVLTPLAKKYFWDKIPKSEKQKATTVLINMGVPHSFVNKGSDFVEEISAYILEFAEEISDEVEFPLEADNADYEKCELCHEIFLKKIYEESEDLFYEVSSEYPYNGGIAVKNTLETFVPLSWDLFYAQKELKEFESYQEDDVYEDNELDEEYENEDSIEELNDDTDMKFEYLHIDTALYEDSLIENIDSIHEFGEVIDTADVYGIDEDEADFYRWVWKYSQNSELADIILNYFSGNDKSRATVDEEYTRFVLSVLGNNNVSDKDYCFDIDMEDEIAFNNVGVVNRIYHGFRSIYTVIYGDFTKLDVNDYLQRILDATYCSYQEKAKIEEDDIWSHVYLAKGMDGLNKGEYIGGYLYDDEYEKSIIMCPSEDIDSYVQALAEYVKDKYSVDISGSLIESFDWKAEYNNLVSGVREFISSKSERRFPEDLFGYIAPTNDVEDFKSEKAIWADMIRQKEKIFARETRGCPVNLEHWRSFLSTKYRGRCQLCGGKTVTGEQNARFFTYRIIKESRNELANITSNLFCLCPSCWGEMGHGDFMGKDLSEILIKTEKYSKYLVEHIKAGDMEDDFSPLIKEIQEDQDLTAEENEMLEGFTEPIVCRVMVNGKDRCMAFSWEHFIRLSFILSEANKNI